MQLSIQDVQRAHVLSTPCSYATSNYILPAWLGFSRLPFLFWKICQFPECKGEGTKANSLFSIVFSFLESELSDTCALLLALELTSGRTSGGVGSIAGSTWEIMFVSIGSCNSCSCVPSSSTDYSFSLCVGMSPLSSVSCSSPPIGNCHPLEAFPVFFFFLFFGFASGQMFCRCPVFLQILHLNAVFS